MNNEYSDGLQNPKRQISDFADKIRDEVTFEELKGAFLEFEKKIAVKGYPGKYSADPQYYTGTHFLAKDTAAILGTMLKRVVGKADKADKARVTAAAGEILLHTWLAVVRVGPHSTHLVVMDTMADDSEPRFKDYIPTLPPSEIATILKAMNVNLQCPKEDEFNMKEFGFQLKCKFSRVYEAFKAEQLAAVQTEFLEVYHNIHAQLPALPEVYADEIKYIVMSIGEKFEADNPYLHLTNVDTFKKHVTCMRDLACSDAMGEDTAVGNITCRTLNRILTGIMADKGNVLEDVFDHLMKTIVQISKHQRAREHGGDVFYAFSNKLFSAMKDSSTAPADTVFESCRSMISEVLASGEPTEEIATLVDRAQAGVMAKIKHEPGNKANSLLVIAKELLLTGKKDLIEKAARTIDNAEYKKGKGKVFVWKNLVPEAIMLIDVVGSQPESKMQDEKNGACRSVKWTVGAYTSFLEKLLDFLRLDVHDHVVTTTTTSPTPKKGKVIPQIQTALVRCLFNCLECGSVLRAEIAAACTDEKHLDLSTVSDDVVTDILRRIGKLLQKRDLQWEDMHLSRTTEYTLKRVLSSYFGKGNPITAEHNKLLLSIVATCGEGDSIEEQFYQEDETDRTTIYYHIYSDLITKLVSLHQKSKSAELLAPVVPDLIKWATIASDEEHEDIKSSMFYAVHAIESVVPAILKDFLPDILGIVLNMEECNSMLWGTVTNLYCLNPKPVHSRFQDIFGMLDSEVEEHLAYVIRVLYTVSQKHPEVFNKDHITRLLNVCGRDQHITTSILMIIQEVAKSNPKIVTPHFPKLTDDLAFKPESFYVRAGLLGYIGRSNQSLGQKTIDYLVKHINYKDQTVALTVLCAVRTLMPKHVDYMQKHRLQLEKTEKTSNTQEIKDMCHQMILVLDGISIEEVFEEVKQQQEDIAELDTKVDATIDTVQNIGEHVIEHHHQIKGVKKDIEHIEERVDDAEDNIEKTNLRVEEIDNKTMTNAPKWSRDLTKLMNPKTDNDWRLLASRLGYNNTDIRGWAQQNDPCMALLSEWYATHKTSEASHAVLTALQEMNRVDGAAIVENAMKAAEGVVEDEEFEYASPPPIFLSYQWGVQDEVRLLQRHLNMAGYECWMDIGQMGGGDKLFAKIDNGIRAAKVVICCTTEKYAQSPNCNREVNLSVNLGKPIIPLLMEKMAWPPKGSMGPIFSEYLFIRFFQRGDEETKDQRYWPVPKFQELLMQLNYYVVPDPKLIKKAYKDWWKPIAEEIVIDEKKSKTGSTQVQSTTQVDQKKQPLVFLSYQWGKQPQVKVLYQRLTSLGYTVWMDIYQMGGGDSLYDKIDRGLRGCQAVVTCVTPKYALSANCRREVSLADALKKPIIPLLLETMTWPPDGPMSMVFTQLLYINFYRDPDMQMTWKGPSFNELCDKLQENIPEVGPANVEAPSDKAKTGGTPSAGKANPPGRPTASAGHEPGKTAVTDGIHSGSKAAPRPTRSTVTKTPVGSGKDAESVSTPRPKSNTKATPGMTKQTPNGTRAGNKSNTADTPGMTKQTPNGTRAGNKSNTADTNATSVDPKSNSRTTQADAHKDAGKSSSASGSRFSASKRREVELQKEGTGDNDENKTLYSSRATATTRQPVNNVSANTDMKQDKSQKQRVADSTQVDKGTRTTATNKPTIHANTPNASQPRTSRPSTLDKHNSDKSGASAKHAEAPANSKSCTIL